MKLKSLYALLPLAFAGPVEADVLKSSALTLGLNLVGVYQGQVPGNANATTGRLELNALSKPTDILSFYGDLHVEAGSGLDSQIFNTIDFSPNVAELQNPLALREAWVSLHSPGEMVDLQLGLLDFTTIFDKNAAANNEATQFLSGSLVNSPILWNPFNGFGAALSLNFSHVSLKAGAQDERDSALDYERLYSVEEMDLRYELLGPAEWRFWARQRAYETPIADLAFGVSMDQQLTRQITLFGRYATSDIDTDDLESYSGGLEFGNLFESRPLDRLGLGYGRNALGEGAVEDFAEAYYQAQVFPWWALSLHGQWLFDRYLSGPNFDAEPQAFVLSLRTQISY